jgi:pimeloyl-ACP methyl ester carboxylesterase
MPKPVIHFAHANSFPAKTYSKVFASLEDEFEISYADLLAHNPRFPVKVGWKELAEELREEIERRHTQPVIGVGHSFGGILHFFLACENPELYRAIILLDAPLVGGARADAVRFTQKTGLITRLPHIRQTPFRRANWKSREEALRHFQNIQKFREFDEEVLRDYITFGTVEAEGGVKLLFDPSIEATIYRTLPTNFSEYAGKLNVPAAYLGGTNSREAKLAGLGFMRRNFPFRFQFIEGSHLFPFEKPRETSSLIEKIIREF